MSTKPDALLNLADAMAEDIFHMPDDEVLREVEEDFGDPCGLANKFDQILECAEKQVFGTARSAASPQVRSSVLDLPYRLLEWCSTLFGSGPGRSGTQFQLFSVNRVVWAGAAGVLIVLILAPAVIRSMSEGQLPSQTAQTELPTTPYGPTTPYFAPPLPSTQAVTDITEEERIERIATALAPLVQDAPISATQPPTAESAQRKLTDKEIEILVARGRELIRLGNIADARLTLKLAAEADNATAALELGATYDPTELSKPAGGLVSVGNIERKADIAMARTWYQKAKDLGSTEALVRLRNLARFDGPR
jgi:hypothetical protein